MIYPIVFLKRILLLFYFEKGESRTYFFGTSDEFSSVNVRTLETSVVATIPFDASSYVLSDSGFFCAC